MSLENLKPSFRFPAEDMAIIKGHYAVRNKMANKIKELKIKVMQLEAELKKLKEPLE